MAEKKQMILNRLPAPTWNWLRVNRTVLDWENENEIDLGAVVRSVQGKENEPLRLEIRGEGEYSRKRVSVDAAPGSSVTGRMRCGRWTLRAGARSFMRWGRTEGSGAFTDRAARQRKLFPGRWRPGRWECSPRSARD